MCGCGQSNGGCGCNRGGEFPVIETGRFVDCFGSSFFSRCGRCGLTFDRCTCFREGECFSCCKTCERRPEPCRCEERRPEPCREVKKPCGCGCQAEKKVCEPVRCEERPNPCCRPPCPPLPPVVPCVCSAVASNTLLPIVRDNLSPPDANTLPLLFNPAGSVASCCPAASFTLVASATPALGYTTVNLAESGTYVITLQASGALTVPVPPLTAAATFNILLAFPLGSPVSAVPASAVPIAFVASVSTSGVVSVDGSVVISVGAPTSFQAVLDPSAVIQGSPITLSISSETLSVQKIF